MLVGVRVSVHKNCFSTFAQSCKRADFCRPEPGLNPKLRTIEPDPNPNLFQLQNQARKKTRLEFVFENKSLTVSIIARVEKLTFFLKVLMLHYAQLEFGIKCCSNLCPNPIRFTTLHLRIGRCFN